MYLLVVLACLKTDPAVCAAHELAVIPDRSAAACQINSRPRVRARATTEAGEGLVPRNWSCVAQPAPDG
jgi:hypothetical protein